MKKIKKILPVLLGVMVLMFGTLTVSAATADTEREYWESLLDSSFGKGVMSYIDGNYSGYKYVAILTENGQKYGRVFLSDCPFYEYQAVDVNGKLYSRVACYNKNNIDCNYVVINYSTPNFSTWSFTGNKYSSKQSTIVLQSQSGERPSDKMLSNYAFVKYDSENNYIPTSTGYDSFFPRLPVTAVAEALPETVTNQTRVILTTAIACLALLTILFLLPKKLPLFLNR